MTFIYFSDLRPIIVSSIIFSLLAVAHRILIPSKYSSYLQFSSQEDDEKRTAQSTAIRILYLIVGTLILYQGANYTEKQIAIGIFISAFLNVWPAILENHLLKIFKTKEEWILLVGYISFVGFSVLIEIITIRLFMPVLFREKEIYWLDNQAISLFFTLIAIIIPIPIETFIAKYSHVVIIQNIDTFLEEVYICERQVNMKNHSIELNKYIINKIAKENDINIKILETIIRLECFYRKRLYYRIMEYILTKYFSFYAIKKDISVGIAQIKISTAQKLLQENPYTFVKELHEDSLNIQLCGKYIKYLISEYKTKLREYEDRMVPGYVDVYDYIACEYLGGIPTNKERTVLVYSAVLRSIMKDQPLYYSGIQESARYYLTLKGEERISYESYEKIRCSIEEYAMLRREIFDNSENYRLETEMECTDSYSLQRVREIAEYNNLSVTYG